MSAHLTVINSNGSGAALPIDTLFERLASNTLDPDFERFGNFVSKAHGSVEAGYDHSVTPPRLLYRDTGPIYPDHPNALSFFGNFFDYSHVFNITTDDPELIERLTAAIRANQATPAYAKATGSAA